MDVDEIIQTAAELLETGEVDAAEGLCQVALALTPDKPELLRVSGRIELHRGRYSEAAQSLAKAASNGAGDAPTLNALSFASLMIQRFDVAVAAASEAVRLDPGLVDALVNLSLAQNALGRYADALETTELAVAKRPNDASLRLARSGALSGLRRLEAALSEADAAVGLAPTLVDTRIRRGEALQALGRHQEAQSAFDAALVLDPTRADARFKRSFSRLVSGDLKGGFADYEDRFRISSTFTPPATLTAPRWKGAEPISGRSILLHCEQGLGDSLQFCRYAPLLAERGATVNILTRSPLLRLFRRLSGVETVRTFGDPIPETDYVCSLMSLPAAFGDTLETVPAAAPYLSADPADVKAWADRLSDLKGLRIGLVWSGGRRAHVDGPGSVNSRRNIPLARLLRLPKDGVNYVSLQIGEPDERAADLEVLTNWSGPTLFDPTESLRDFADTAALIANLDLVISVDTAVVHLAGALDKEVWLLNRYDTCWRWMQDRDDSPWYPKLRQYRQLTDGDWDSVVDRVSHDLRTRRELASHKQ